jgi:hypothetical protein
MKRNTKQQPTPTKKDIAKQYIRGAVEKQVAKGKTKLKNKAKAITKNQMLDYYEKI